MQKSISVTLHRHKTEAVRRFHPWVFSGAIKRTEGKPAEGDVVEVKDEAGKTLGVGFWGTGSIAVRLFSFEKVDSLEDLWQQKIAAALAMRQRIGLTEHPHTNAYRLVNAEGDGMPGLIVDVYNDVAVIQTHNKGMHAQAGLFAEAIQKAMGYRISAIYDKSVATLAHHSGDEHEGLSGKDGFLVGQLDKTEVQENGNRFLIDFQQGQKTGFFLDQRDNRALLANYAAGKKILNTFCYSGGFSIYGLKAGASLVHSVDSSAKAIALTDENVIRNFGQLSDTTHQSFTSDVFDFMKTAEQDYDIMILDPPAFAKSFSARHRAIQAYTRLNATAFKKIKPQGMVFTFSCSQVVTPDLFNGAITAAAIEAGRKIKILHRLTQPADHPVSIFNPEGNYLKGLVLYVE
ncbi:MAG: class I SAM-dependent rRNA methyltransferase [Bacteroidetes bacterium]|nr:class I SAM-dependent rRNA methyltransferase [Bacteroidota bacterium]